MSRCIFAVVTGLRLKTSLRQKNGLLYIVYMMMSVKHLDEESKTRRQSFRLENAHTRKMYKNET
jgi:hypothetical protein